MHHLVNPTSLHHHNSGNMSLETLTKQLTTHFNSQDYETCAKTLPAIKVELVKNGLLIPYAGTTVNPNDLLIARSILEIGALTSINLLDYAQFENYISQLKSFYQLSHLETSKNESKIISLFLLLLLSQGDLASFHIELEYFQNRNLTTDDLEKDQYLSIPINLEKWLIDGDYYKIYDFLSQDHNKFPCNEFKLFKNNLVDAVRLEVWENLQKSYDSLPVSNCKLLLFMSNLSDGSFKEKVSEVFGDSGYVVEKGIVYFKNESLVNSAEENDEKKIVKDLLTYAMEMENIV